MQSKVKTCQNLLSRQETPNGVSKGLRSRGVDAEGRSRRSGLQREVMVAMMVVMKVVIVVMVV